MAREIETIGIAAEGSGVAVDPDNGAPYLLGHGEQATARLIDIYKIENDIVCPALTSSSAWTA